MEASGASADAHSTGQVAGGALAGSKGHFHRVRQGREPSASSLEFSKGSAPRNTGCAASNSKIRRRVALMRSECRLGSAISLNNPDTGS